MDTHPYLRYHLPFLFIFLIQPLPPPPPPPPPPPFLRPLPPVPAANYPSPCPKHIKMHGTTTHHRHVFLTLLPLLLLLHLPFTTSDIQTVTISSDSRGMIEFEEFGFTKTGHISLTLSSISITTTNLSVSTHTNSSRFGFFVAPEYTEIDPDACILDNSNLTVICTLAELSPPPLSSLSKTVTITKPDNYVFMFGKCIPHTSVSMKVHFELYNLDANGVKDYLPDGETQLPTLYSIFSLFYIPFVVFWLYFCHKNRLYLQKIHIFMAVLLIMKALNLIFAAEDKYHVKTTGTPRGWDTLFYTFQFIRAMLLFTVTILIGTGWSFLKPFLQDKEKNLLMIGIPLQVLVNIAYIVIGESGPYAKNYGDWMAVFLFVDIACCFLIMFPVTWSIRSLRETSKMDGRAATNLKKLRLFRDFYAALVVYMYFTRYSTYFLKLYLEYQVRWMSDAISETATLVFYVSMFYMFRPLERNQYFALALDDEEEEEALNTIQGIEFADY